MNRLVVASLFAAGILIAGCAGATPTASPTAGGVTPTPGGTPPLTTPPASGPTPTTSFGGTNEPPLGNICSAFPTRDPNNPLAIPSSAPDPGLEAHFPASIDGNPVTDVTSGSWAQFACYFGPGAVQSLQGTAGYNLAALTWGSATATVDDEDVEVSAFRTPGGDANQIVATLAQLAAAVSQDTGELGTLSQGTAGGKSVLIYTDPDGAVSYGLVIGDTLVFAEDITQSQADKIFAAVR